ncbi:hypothetical protein [Qipengyuania flava]|uniref:hypothetical protein n=1 Tax=Qipengyuania flava TaxID=192812 RepID=UPI001C626366|nr:hypothetical protein [Qipengyuania flava]QYJ07901.1 hypothetical protein KUV82_04095 [Qipengyuania flava]
MIGKVIGAFVGDRIAKQTKGIGGASGAALGVIATSVLRRMSLPAMIALGVGGYVAKKVIDKNTSGADTTPESTSAKETSGTTSAKPSKAA